MSDQPEKPETLDPLPWANPRLTRAEYDRQVIASGGTPTDSGYGDHLKMTDREIKLCDDLLELRRGASSIRTDLEPKFCIRYYGGKARVAWPSRARPKAKPPSS